MASMKREKHAQIGMLKEECCSVNAVFDMQSIKRVIQWNVFFKSNI